MSLVFQNIDPPPPSPPGECVLPPTKAGGGYTLAGRRGGWGVNILEDERRRLPSYSNNLSTNISFNSSEQNIYKHAISV
jgi:hypothetical protein